MKYQQEEICTSKGRESRYTVYPLDEDKKPAQYYGTDESPIGEYALIDRQQHNYVIDTIEADSYSEAYDYLVGKYIEVEL